MIVKQKSKVIPIEKSSTHYKMYKGGKLWLTAGITTLSMAGMMVATGELQTAHADTTTTANNTQQTATGGNAVTATTSGTSGQAGTITQPVNIDHSQLNNAVDQARQAGLTVNQQPTTTQTVSQDQVDAAKQNIQNDETKQAQRIQTITRQHQTEVSNVNNFNGSKGDTSQLDARVKEAQSIPGLTVVHDQDQTTVKKASDTQGIQEAVDNATQSNNDQAQSIQNAIDTQKRNNDEYQQDLEKATKDNVTHWTYHIDNGYFVDLTADADITWHYDIATDNVVVTNLQLKLNRQNPPKRGRGFWDTFIFTQPQAQLPTETGTFLGSNGDLDYIKTAHDVWDKVLSGRNDVYAYFSQNNKTEENSIIYNLQNFKPYNAQKNADGSWTLLSVFDRWNWHLNGGDSDPLGVRWGKDSVAATLKGIPPVRKTTEVHYHYNTSAINLNFPNNIDDLIF